MVHRVVSACALAAVLAMLLGAVHEDTAPRAPEEAPPPPKKVLPATLTEIAGQEIDLAALTDKQRLVVITLKAPWCRVCVHQLERIKENLPEYQRVRATFLILSPGPKEDLAAIKEHTEFPYPFVADKDNELARALDLVLQPGQMIPAVFALNAAREVVWMERGRSSTRYNDEALREYLGIGGDMARAS